MKKIETLFNAAVGIWVDADWTHENGQDPDGNPVYCDGSEECATCNRAREDAAEASRLAACAMIALGEGRLLDAAGMAEDVRDLESEYGDAPTWGAWSRAVEGKALQSDNGVSS